MNQFERLPRLGRPRERGEVDAGPDEHDHDQRRDVAEELDVAGGELAQQPVVRQPGDADQGAEDHRQRDADDDDADRVEEAGGDRLADRVGRRERVVGDGDARRLVEEVER